MKKLNFYKRQNRKSLDLKKLSHLKKKLKNKESLNNTFNINMSSLYNDVMNKNVIKNNKKEIDILSNANLNILKTLSTFVKEEILNNSSDFPNSKRFFSPIKSRASLTCLNSGITDIKKTPKKLKKIIQQNSNPNSSQLSFNSQKIQNNHKLIQNFSFNRNKHNVKRKHKRHSLINVRSNLLSTEFLNEIKEDKLLNLRTISNKNLEINYEMKTKINYEEFINEMQIMKINNNLRKDINFIKLKKHIKKITDSIKDKRNGETNVNNSNGLIQKKIYENYVNKFRILKRKKELYDSLDDEEYKEEILGFYIPPDSLYIKIFDCILLIMSFTYSIFVPILLSKNYFSKNDNIIINYILILFDIIYIIDCIINSFKGYNNFDEHLIVKTKKIMRHYLKTWFAIDFLQAIPFFSLFIYDLFSFKFDFDFRFQIILLLKVLKLYKMLYYNNNISHLGEIISSNEIIDNYGGFLLIIFIILIILNLNSCLFIFIGNNPNPGWIVKMNMQNESFLIQYLASIYFIIVTITTVGYGDITGITYTETAFQIYLLIIGTIAYSYTISYISNMIIKNNKRSMNFEKNMNIIQDIKLHHPHMKDSLYSEVLRNIYNMKLYERKDKHILLDSLPYSLKNKLIISMNQQIISDFNFFKNIDNSDFIVKVVTSLVPIISIKNDIVVKEGNYITEIIFVKKGVISLNINFDLNNVEYSLNKYFYKNQIGKFNAKYSFNDDIKHKLLLKKTFNANLNSSTSSKSSSYTDNASNSNNSVDLKIIEIRNNEHFGDALMFLNERSPLNAKIRTKTAELLLLRKLEAIEIYSLYPNIWKRINKISLYNMEQIYLKIKKSVINFANINNIIIDTFFLKKTKTKNKKIINSNEKNQHKNIKKIFNEKPIYSKIASNLSRDNTGRLTEKSYNYEIKNKINKNQRNIINANNVINIKQPNNVNISLIHIGTEDINKNDKIKEISNISNFKFPKIKAYFQNDSNIDNEKNVETETKLFRKEEKDGSLSPCISKIFDDKLFFNSNSIGKEKILYNSFVNLEFKKENNFQINSSYKNINKLTNNKYIKDKNLQLKIENILKEEKNEASTGRITNLSLINTAINFHKKSSFKSLINNSNKKAGDLTNKNITNILSFKDNDKFLFQQPLTNDINNQDNKFNSSKKLLLFIDPQENNPLKSSTIKYQRKMNRAKTRKKTGKIKQQLDQISKNIENSSKNINNPEKFYSKFFKNIIDKEKHMSHSNNKTPVMRKSNHKNNTNLFNYYLQDNIGRDENLSVKLYKKTEKDSNE